MNNLNFSLIFLNIFHFVQILINGKYKIVLCKFLERFLPLILCKIINDDRQIYDDIFNSIYTKALRGQ